MFADELQKNAAQQRAAENRQRRLKIKQQQAKASFASTSPTNAFKAKETSTATSGAITEASTLPVKTETNQTIPFSSGTSISAVTKASQERARRANQVREHQRAVQIQSRARGCITRDRMQRNIRADLVSKMYDLRSVRDLLSRSQNITTYIPPPATTTTLVRSLWFITSRRESQGHTSVPWGSRRVIVWNDRQDVILLSQVLQYAVTPGLQSPDENVNPFACWNSSEEGNYRMKFVMRIILVALVDPSVEPLVGNDVFDACQQCLKAVMAVPRSISSLQALSDCRVTVVRTCWDWLLPNQTEAGPRTRLTTATTASQLHQPCAYFSSPLDMLSIWRHYLLFTVAGPKPIPPMLDLNRETCVSHLRKQRIGVWIRNVCDAVEQASDHDARGDFLMIRLVREIYTIPLLTWKVSNELLAYWVTSSGTKGCPFVSALRLFGDKGDGLLQNDGVENLFPFDDVPMTVCPATPTQCFLANVVQLGLLCPTLNGTDSLKLDFGAAVVFFNLITVLVQAIPLATFSSRDSAVVWVDGVNGHTIPIVLSKVIQDQCRAIMVDSFVRRIFQIALDPQVLGTENILSTKSDKDLKHEKDMLEVGSSSAASLAAKEARVDRNKSFWNSSKWARKLTKGMSSLLVGEDAKKRAAKNLKPSSLRNQSTVSRNLAEGVEGDCSDIGTIFSTNIVPRSDYTVTFLFCLCRCFSVVVARWGGAGNDDMLLSQNRESAKGEFPKACIRAEPFIVIILNALCFSTPFVQCAWGIMQSDRRIASQIHSIVEMDEGKSFIRCLDMQTGLTGISNGISDLDGAALLFMFAVVLSHTLIITDDVEIHDMDRPLPKHQLRRVIQLLKKLLYRACCIDSTSLSVHSNYFGVALISASSRAMRDLYDRSSRRPICVPKLWLLPNLLEKDLSKCNCHAEYVALLSTPVLRMCPFLVSFKRRLKLFERIVTTNRVEIQGENSSNPFNPNPLKKGVPVRITRGRILEDGLATMNHLGRNMRQRLSVQYFNEAGAREAGIDAGGLFKEFWTDLCAIAFNPDYALFSVTDGAGNCLYPNPSSGAAHGTPDHIVLFEFLGRILGKALFEGITINPRFAHFFLSFLRGDYNYLHMLADLSTVDPQLYNNLMFLKAYEGDTTDLCLTFSIMHDQFGGNKDVLLIPDGANVEVTNVNKQRYVELVAKHYVVDRVKDQSEAFTRGLWEVIDRSWLRLFNEPELQVLISGVSDGKLDVEDLRAHSRYAGGFTGIDRTVNRFWSVLSSMSSKQQADLLRFVTSCERPPPLGFGSLNPPFTIQRVGILRDGDKLPSASTCFNVLKLPTYSSEKVLKQRLLYAIESGAGFELS